MTEGREQADANYRLINAIKDLGVAFRIDEDGRMLVSDGEQEYEVTVDLTRLLRKQTGNYPRRIVVGKSSLIRLERGDITELFPHGVVSAVDKARGSAARAVPVSPQYAPLVWQPDQEHLDGDDGIAAESDDWRYTIHPVRGADDQVIGYWVSGGDNESGDELGSSLVGGRVGELDIEKAKAAAEENYASRYREAEQFLDGLFADWDDANGPRIRRNDKGRIVCRVEGPGTEEVEVVATLRDWDDYDPSSRRVALSLRTILSYAHSGDRDGLLDELHRLIRA